jgi:hypothetical protein
VNAILNRPQSLVIFNNTIFLAEFYKIRTITFSGDVRTYAGNGMPGYVNGNLKDARFNFINGIIMDKFGNLYIADSHNHVVRMISNTGVVSTYAGMFPWKNVPGFVDGDGNIN